MQESSQHSQVIDVQGIRKNISPDQFALLTTQCLHDSGFTIDNNAMVFNGIISFKKIFHTAENHFGSISNVGFSDQFSFSVDFHFKPLIEELISMPPGYFSLWGPDETHDTWENLTTERFHYELSAAVHLWFTILLLGLVKLYRENSEYIDNYFRNHSHKNLFAVDCYSFGSEIHYQICR